ncbi:MAG: sugar transferase [Actinobacteria bacterium]|nr:sugar transferase [Actinomycetota bacterium]
MTSPPPPSRSTATPQEAGERLASRDVRFVPILRGRQGRDYIRRALSVVALLAIDISSVFLGLYAVLAFKLILQGQPIDSGAIWSVEQKALPLATITLVLVFAKYGLYAEREERGGSSRILSAITVSTLIVLALTLASGWRFNTFYIFYSSWFAIAVLVIVLRASWDSVTALVLDWITFERRALIVGNPDITVPIAESITRGSNDRHGVAYRVVGTHSLVAGVGTEHELPAARELDLMLDPAQIDEVILAGQAGRDQSILDLLDVCRRRSIPVRLAPTTAQLLSHSIRAVPAPGLPLFELRPPVLSGLAFYAKRAFDLVVGALLVVLLSPIMLLAAAAIWFDDRGPITYRNRRMGVEAHPFDCLKFRTMRVRADQQQADLEHRNEADGALFKIADDPRVTKVGKVIRRFSIDELPQLFNVLKGEMSLVGPRPLPERDFLLLDDLHKKRYLVLPGMTGLWQVSGRADLSFDELVRLDFYYIETWSIWLDLVILVRTVPAVLFKKGAY